MSSNFGPESDVTAPPPQTLGKNINLTILTFSIGDFLYIKAKNMI